VINIKGVPRVHASKHRAAIIGAGSVGAAVAHSLLLRNVASEILLVDIDSQRCNAQVQDLSDSAFLSGSTVKRCEYGEAANCDINIIAAGAKRRPGNARLDLVEQNLAVLKDILQSLQPLRPDGILLLVSNPVDVITYFAQKWSNLPSTQVIGSGTFLDSIRLRHELAEMLQVVSQD
jgi:L-lactate dehydrogenase